MGQRAKAEVQVSRAGAMRGMFALAFLMLAGAVNGALVYGEPAAAVETR